MMGMMGMTLSRSVDIHECATYAIGAVEVKTGAILHEQGIQYENKFYLSYCIRYSWRIAPVLTSTAPIAYVVHSWISKSYLRGVLRMCFRYLLDIKLFSYSYDIV